MGNYVSSNFFFARSSTPIRLLIQGLDASGKTTILYQLKLGEVVTTIPTIGFNVEEIQNGSTVLVAWDVGGRSKIRALWRHYYKNTNALVFVIDSNDPDRLEQARDELDQLFNEDELRGIPVLILCNKQDLPNALSPEEIAKRLGNFGESYPKKHLFQVVGCSAITGDGLKEGLDWLNWAVQAEKERVALEQSLKKKKEADNRPKVTSQLSPKKEQVTTKSKQDFLVKLGYDPSDGKTNSILQNFRPIQQGTECPFAKAAKLWGVSSGDKVANASALEEFVRRSNAGETLDGFCVELPPEAAKVRSPVEFGQYTYRALRDLSDLDPSGERVMQVSYIGARGWRFRFAKADFFVTTFAPCYPTSSSRYAFGTGKAFVLLQPELSFLRHNLPLDTPATADPPKTIRDKTRLAFRDAGRSYYIPSTTKYPPAEHIVKPLHDNGVNIVHWWEDDDVKNETKTATV